MPCEIHPEGCPRGSHNVIGEPGHTLEDGLVASQPTPPRFPTSEASAAAPTFVASTPTTIPLVPIPDYPSQFIVTPAQCDCGMPPAHLPEIHEQEAPVFANELPIPHTELPEGEIPVLESQEEPHGNE